MSTVRWTEPTTSVHGSTDSLLQEGRWFFDLQFGFNEVKGVSLDLIYTVGLGSDDRGSSVGGAALGLRGGVVGAPHQSWRRASYGAWQHRIFGAKQHGGHEESYLGFGGREEAVPRAHGVGATSPVQDDGGGLPRWSPGSQFQSHGSTSSSLPPPMLQSWWEAMNHTCTEKSRC
jgi:hypothetical protein